MSDVCVVFLGACQHNHKVVLVCWGLPWFIPSLVALLGVFIHSFIHSNPDKDICSPGVCLLAHLSPDQINVYDQKGAWIATLPVSLLTGLAAMARAKMWESSNFATAVRGLLHAPLHAARWCTALQSFSHYFSLPTAVMHALQNTFGLQAEWFASPIDRCMNLSSYASDRDADTLFGSLGNATTSNGWVHVSLTQA